MTKPETPAQKCLREAIEKIHSQNVGYSRVIERMKETDPEGIKKMDDYYEDNYGTRPYGTDRKETISKGKEEKANDKTST